MTDGKPIGEPERAEKEWRAALRDLQRASAILHEATTALITAEREFESAIVRADDAACALSPNKGTESDANHRQTET